LEYQEWLDLGVYQLRIDIEFEHIKISDCHRWYILGISEGCIFTYKPSTKEYVLEIIDNNLKGGLSYYKKSEGIIL
jgi:hypothetical protein